MRSKNKEDWGPGPWQDEPDRAEWVDEVTGLHCRIRRGPGGSLCGYVGVPKGHPAYGIGYDPYVGDCVDENVEWWRRYITHRIEYKIKDIAVHGGLTFAGSHTDSDLHWFGFDCAHAFDFVPRFNDILHSIRAGLNVNGSEIYRGIDYVTEQVTSLAQQLAAIKEEPYAEENTG